MEYSVTKIMDIDPTQLDPRFVEELTEHQGEDYRDQVLKEHIYGFSTLEELTSEEFEVYDTEIVEQAKDIMELMTEEDCCYLRFIWS